LEVEQLTIPKEKAQEEFEALKQVFKQHHTFRSQDQIYKDMAKVYGHLQHGKKIIDIHEAFKKAGLNEESDPKLAIVRADAKECHCRKYERGAACFSILQVTQRGPLKKDGGIVLPEGTFQWVLEQPGYSWSIARKDLKTIVPVIPPSILVTEVKLLLPNYYLLWEVEKWQPIPPRDPILLKKLTPNLYGVLATWNLTELERAIIRGRIS